MTVIVQKNFRKHTALLEEGIEEGMADIAETMKAATRAAARSRYRSGGMDRGFDALVRKTTTGFEAECSNDRFYSLFQDEGTKRGVTPAHFFLKGLRAAIPRSTGQVRRRVRQRGL